MKKPTLGLNVVNGILGTFLLFAASGCLSAAPSRPTLRVMSFNIRYGTAPDGENRWEKRKDLVVKTIRAFSPDLLGTQEVMAFQAEFLRRRLSEYDFVGVGREDGKKAGEFAAIFFRRDRFEKLAEGHFWLSTTPEKPGSKSWDSALPRITSWVKLRLCNPPGTEFYFFNTHFDHRGARARLESARIMKKKIASLGPGALVIVTGDFNAAPGSPPHRVLVGAEGDEKTLLYDSFAVLHPSPEAEEGTFHGFSGKAGKARIDWILFSRGLKPLTAAVDRTNEAGRYPSDHFPVTAVFEIEGKGTSSK